MAERLPLFCTAARGTEDLLAEELEELGASRIRQDRGGVRFSANIDEALRICLWTRIAMRILYPLGEFEAEGADGLYAAAGRVPWEEYLSPETTFSVEASLKDSEHRHSGFVALKIKDALVDRMRKKRGARPDVDSRDATFRVVAHLKRKALSLSLDLVGEPLFQRGYRRAPTAAPMKETLAAAILRAAKYSPDEPFYDPMCGSGTLAIEASWMAIRRAPSLRRRFALEGWPFLKQQAKAVLPDLRREAEAEERKPPAPIYACDRDEEAIAAARKNVSAAKARDAVRLSVADALSPPPFDAAGQAGLLVTNPPYGDRLRGGGQKGMKTFYFQLGESIRRLQGWRAFLLSGNPAFESAFHARPMARRKMYNGAIECELLGYKIGT